MKTIINLNRFLKAVEYVSEQHFSKPYSLTPIAARWFNQLAMIQLANGQIVHLTGDVAFNYVDIFLDGSIVDRKDILLVLNYESKSFEFESARLALAKKLYELKLQLKSPTESTIIEEISATLKIEENNFITLIDEKNKSIKLYEDIVARGVSSLNKNKFEQVYNSTIKKIVYRPNHDLTHSVRAGYLITAYYTCAKEQGLEFKDIDDSELEKLQNMMLFSVVGRKDESGFNETILNANANGRTTYQSFRAASAREFFNYSRDNSQHLYNSNKELLYRDALIVEFMGFLNIEEAISDKHFKSPDLLIDYVIESELSLGIEVTREAAIKLIKKKVYSIHKLFPAGEIRLLASHKLYLMNQAHSLDLPRCYTLFAPTTGGSNCLKYFNELLKKFQFYEFSDSPDAEKITSFFKLMRCVHDGLAITGQKSLFGLLSVEAFESQKDILLKDIKKVSDKFLNEPRADLLKQAKSSIKDVEVYFGLKSRFDKCILREYREYCILLIIATRLFAAPRLLTNKIFFNFQNNKEGRSDVIDHQKNAEYLVNALQITFGVGEQPGPLPVITSVKYDLVHARVSVFFDTSE